MYMISSVKQPKISINLLLLIFSRQFGAFFYFSKKCFLFLYLMLLLVFYRSMCLCFSFFFLVGFAILFSLYEIWFMYTNILQFVKCFHSFWLSSLVKYATTQTCWFVKFSFFHIYKIKLVKSIVTLKTKIKKSYTCLHIYIKVLVRLKKSAKNTVNLIEYFHVVLFTLIQLHTPM